LEQNIQFFILNILITQRYESNVYTESFLYEQAQKLKNQTLFLHVKPT
jgi:hypothetical protein